MRLLLILVGLGLTWLSACAPTHPFDGLDRSAERAGGGQLYRIHWNAERAKATRLDPRWRPAHAGVLAGAVAATEAATGCAATPERGDLALVILALDCTR